MTPTVIDLYHEDDVTSWSELVSAGITTVIHKATEGATDVDPLYAAREPQARAAGLQWAAYHFWRPDDAAAQARIFLATVDGGTSNLWLDYEVAGGTPSKIMALMQAVNEATGKTMGLYTTRSLAEDLASGCFASQQKDFFKNCPLWLADPGVSEPELTGSAALLWPTISLWQYTWNGRIAGVSGKVDLNCVPEGAAVARPAIGAGTGGSSFTTA